MKLLSHEQKDLMRALHEAGIDQHFHFVKKKGWVLIKHPRIDQCEFSFHRKKETVLEDGRFVNKLNYFVKTKGQIDEYSTWPEVLDIFCDWLKDSG